MSQTTTDMELDDIISEVGQTSEPSPAPWSKQEDDELLKELYALMGDIPKEPEKPAERAAAAPKPAPEAPKPAQESAPSAQPAAPKPNKPAAEQTPAQRPAAPELTPAAPAQPAPMLPEQEPTPARTAVQEDWEELPSERSAPGWLKGTFLFLISLLLCGMTLYAVAADVLGPLF